MWQLAGLTRKVSEKSCSHECRLSAKNVKYLVTQTCLWLNLCVRVCTNAGKENKLSILSCSFKIKQWMVTAWPQKQAQILLDCLCDLTNRLVNLRNWFTFAVSLWRSRDPFNLLHVESPGFCHSYFDWAGHELIMRISGNVVIPCLSHSLSTQQQLQSLQLENEAFSWFHWESECSTPFCGHAAWRKGNCCSMQQALAGSVAVNGHKNGLVLDETREAERCQPPASSGGNSETEWVQECES